MIFGAPTYMVSVSAVMKAFMEAAFDPFMTQRWKDKFGTAFTNSAAQNGDKLNSLMQFVIFADQMGMLWVPVGDLPGNSWSGGSVRDNNQMGSWIGLMGQSNGDQAQILLHPRVIVAPRNNMGSGLLRSCAIGNERGITRPSDRAKSPRRVAGPCRQ